MPAAYVGAAAAVYGAVSQSGAASSAAGQQAAGQQASLGLQSQMYNQSQLNLQPYLQGGALANTALLNRLGIVDPTAAGGANHRLGETDLTPAAMAQLDQIYAPYGGFNAARAAGSSFQSLSPDQQAAINQQGTDAVNALSAGSQQQSDGFGSLVHSFDASDLNANMAPNYAFMLDQGQTANKNAANLSGGLLGGNALQGLNTFTQNYAQNAYQQAYQNYNTNQSNIFSRLSGVAQTGQNSAVNAASNAINAGQSMGQTTANIGTAQAGGTIGSANALAGGLNNASSYYQLGQIMNGGGSGTNLSPAGGGYATGMADINSQIAALPA